MRQHLLTLVNVGTVTVMVSLVVTKWLADGDAAAVLILSFLVLRLACWYPLCYWSQLQLRKAKIISRTL